MRILRAFCVGPLFLALCMLLFPINSAAQSYKITDLGTLGGASSEAFSVNASGEITGYAGAASGVSGGAFLYSGGKMTNLGTLGGTISLGEGINTSGEIVGYSTLSTNSYGAFLYSAGKMTNLGILAGITPSLMPSTILDRSLGIR